ncbi:MAG: BT_3928 family protein [Bacteroidota bacterium]
MKTVLLIIRWIVGLLFIFSGLIKANDPLGLSYKMQEFFEVWGIHSLNDYTLALSMIMNVFEVVAGVAVIIGWRMKLFSWLLLLLIIFFTFLTGYALFSGKIKTCGCFGDCLPLTPAQSFGKDIFLLVLIVILFASANKIKSALKPAAALVLLLLVTITTTAGQFYVLKNLPFVDCLPYKKGNNLQEQMKMPAGAIPDSLSIMFIYKKNGKQLEFDQLHFPVDFDSTYEYVDRKDKVVRKGNGLQPKIMDFSLQTFSGTDTTAAVLGQPGNYLMVMAKDMDHVQDWSAGFEKIKQTAQQKNIPVLLVSADADKAVTLFPNTTIVKCDATVLKTAARVVPTYFIMNGATVLSKRSYTGEGEILEEIGKLR